MNKKTQFRPCIDLHQGQVKQIVGGSLTDDGATENHVSEFSAGYFAQKFRDDRLTGGHVIQLGPGNFDAAVDALDAYPGGLQIGGGVTIENAQEWIDRGASHVIVTSWLFDSEGRFQPDRLAALVERVSVERLVIDLSCRRTQRGWTVAMNRWQTLTNVDISTEILDLLAGSCDQFLIHAADVEGKCAGIDDALVQLLGQWRSAAITYAGGVANMQDVERVQELSGGYVDVTVGSALDLFGGDGVCYDTIVQWNRR